MATQCRIKYNPADWVIDVAQGNTMEELQKTSFFAKQPNDLLATVNTTKDGAGLDILPDSYSVSIWKEFSMLQKREFSDLLRNPAGIVINVVVTGVLSVIFGVIFFGIGRKDRSDFSVSKDDQRWWRFWWQPVSLTLCVYNCWRIL